MKFESYIWIVGIFILIVWVVFIVYFARLRHPRIEPNKHRLQDPKAQRFVERWKALRPTSDQIEKIGEAYMLHILGVGHETIQGFIHNDHKAYDEVGTKQSAIPFRDGTAFWAAVAVVFPDLLLKEADIAYLVDDGKVVAVCVFLDILEPVFQEKTRIFRMLRENAADYK